MAGVLALVVQKYGRVGNANVRLYQLGQAQYGSSGGGGSLCYEVNNAEDRSQSVEKVAESLRKAGKVSTYLWDTITEKAVREYEEGDDEDGFVVAKMAIPPTGLLPSWPKFRTPYGTMVSFKRGVWDPAKRRYEEGRLKVINTPILKSHFIFGVTGAVKSYMGVNSDKLTAARGHRTHPLVGVGGMGTLMAETRVPVLNVLDAVRVNARPGTGPKTPFDGATPVGVLAAGTDPVALDYWASKNILCPVAKARYGVEPTAFSPDNVEKGSFGDWLKLSCAELNRAGYSYTFDEKRIAVRLARAAP